MTVADMNVRLARGGPAATALGARRSVLARLLLFIRRHRLLDRKLLLLLAVPLMPACIIPVGPEFSDPTGTPNGPPRITGADPSPGEVVTALNRRDFHITVTDPNVGDHLFLRWISDYPPFNDMLTRQIASGSYEFMPPRDGTLTGGTFGFTIVCTDLSASSSGHRLKAVVADRNYVAAVDTNLINVPAPGQFDEADWFLTLTSCQMQ
jgi:hypothetical protein